MQFKCWLRIHSNIKLFDAKWKGIKNEVALSSNLCKKTTQEATLEKNTLKIIMAELKWQKYGWFYFANFL